VALRPEPSLRRTADIVFTRQRIAVFIDGCYWHSCPEHSTIAHANADYWSEKLAGNVARDVDTTRRLRAAGWTVLRFWEHQDPGEVAQVVIAAVQGRSKGR
jgi:DNA mismatch endonuclease (patch repair protein)